MSSEKKKSNYMIDFYVRNEYIPNEQRFIFLLETENASLCC